MLILGWSNTLPRCCTVRWGTTENHFPALHPMYVICDKELHFFQCSIQSPGELRSHRFQLQPQSNTPDAANHGVQGYVIISDRCVEAGSELKSAGRCLSRSRVGDPWSRVCSSQNSLTQDIKACYAPISPQWKGLMPPVVQLYTSAVFGLKRKHRTRKSHVLHEHNRTISPSCKSINRGILHANDHLTQANQIGDADLCTAVYQPAASVRFITTSTGIRSATASLLALMVRRMPFPACTGRDTQNTLQRGRQAHKHLGLAVHHTGV